MLATRPLADSTNALPRSSACTGPKHNRSRLYPTTSTRSSCSWSDPHHHPLSFAPSPFILTSKAPPTVSVSLSAACSQSAPRHRSGSSGVQGLGSDLPDVTSVVPFPSTSSQADTDVEMLDGTCPHLPFAGQGPRKRRSACSSVSSSQSPCGKEANQKRPRKSKRQVTELWWLGVVHRSITQTIEARESAESSGVMHAVLSQRDFDAMDRVLVEKIQKRLNENGCGEGRFPTCPLPRVSSPSISSPSLNLLVTGRKTVATDSLSELSAKEDTTIPATPSLLSLSTSSPIPISSPSSMSHRRHVRFQVTQRPRPLQSHLSMPRRSPSPPARTGTIPANERTLTLTMPQLVASLTLAYNERHRPRARGRTCGPADYGENAGRSPPSASCQDARSATGDATQEKERIHRLRERLTSAPERKSPLSRVTYANG